MKLTNQEIFSRVLAHLRQQKRRSAQMRDLSLMCEYSMEDPDNPGAELYCAVGVLLEPNIRRQMALADVTGPVTSTSLQEPLRESIGWEPVDQGIVLGYSPFLLTPAQKEAVITMKLLMRLQNVHDRQMPHERGGSMGPWEQAMQQTAYVFRLEYA